MALEPRPSGERTSRARSASPALSPPPPHLLGEGEAKAAWALFGWELLRVARGWRWRALVVVAAVGAFWWRREGFGPGRPVFFPLGARGLFGFSALFVGAAALLGVDAIGQVERARAARILDSRPVADWGLALVRWAAASVLVAAAAAAFLMLTRGLCSWLGQPCAAAPLAALWFSVWVPAIFLAAALGLAIRAWVPSDAAALLLALAGSVGAGAFAVAVLDPVALFEHYTPHTGLVVPLAPLRDDALRATLLALSLVLIAAVGQRRWMARSCVRLRTPRRPGREFFALPGLRTVLGRLRSTDRITALLLFLLPFAAFFGVRSWIEEWNWARASVSPWRADFPDFPPELARTSVPEWRIRRLDATFEEFPPERSRFVLHVENTTTRTLEWGALSLSPLWERVEIGGGGGEARHGPLPGAWLFRWTPPLDPASTTTLAIAARAHPGSARVRAAAALPRYADLGRMGAWWPRACGFDLVAREANIPDRPLHYRLVLPAADLGRGRPVCGSARIGRDGERWVLTSTRPETAILPVFADYEAVERDFEGLVVRLEVFPGHRELARFLLDLWGDRFVLLRRALGTPDAPFVFREAAAPTRFPDPMAIASAWLDALREAMPDVESEHNDTYPLFDRAFAPWQRGLLETWVHAGVGDVEEPWLLRDALIDYLHEFAFARGERPSPRRLREQARPVHRLVPWRPPASAPRPFDFREADLPRLRIPWDESLAALRTHDDLAHRRARAFHHVIRHLLGETHYPAFLQDLLARGETGGRLTREDVYRMAQSRTSTPVRPVAEQLLGSGRLPTFDVREGRVFLDRHPRTRALEYTTEVTVANLGEGRWPVGVVLDTEGDPVERRLELGGGERLRLRLVTRARPLALFVDPHGWVPQIPLHDPEAQSVQTPRFYFREVISRVEER